MYVQTQNRVNSERETTRKTQHNKISLLYPRPVAAIYMAGSEV